MPSHRCLRNRARQLVILLISLALLPTAWASGKYKVLYSFAGGNDGIDPQGNLVMDARGNLYGTTVQGGGTSACNGRYKGCGVVFQLTPYTNGKWEENVLYAFQNGASEGVGLNGSLVLDASGNLYGTAFWDGTNFQGTVFELSPGMNGWTESTVYQFCSQKSCTDGSAPGAGVIFGQSGSLYGTTTAGGVDGGGVAFELVRGSSGWKENVLFNFCPFNPCNRGGWFPWGLVQDASGNFYGMTTWGGNYVFPCVPGDGCGAVIELRPTKQGWKEAALRRFTGRDGAFPESSVTLDKYGNMYGTTTNDGAFGCGTVFQLSPGADRGWRYHVIYNLRGGPSAGSLVLDSKGNLYGANSSMNTGTCTGSEGGEIFKLSPGAHGRWKYSSVYKLTGGQGGGVPSSGLIFDKKGHLYGTAAVEGANGYGVVFEVTP